MVLLTGMLTLRYYPPIVGTRFSEHSHYDVQPPLGASRTPLENAVCPGAAGFILATLIKTAEYGVTDGG